MRTLLASLLLICTNAFGQVFIVKGTVTDNKTNKPIKGAEVRLEGSDGLDVRIKTDSTGIYFFDSSKLKSNTSYIVSADASDQGYLASPEKYNFTAAGKRDSIYTANFNLVRSGCGWINFPDFKYAFDKAELTKDMIDTTLNYYVKLLKENPTIKAEFDGFATYGEKSPIRLSIERALVVKINLFTMGIDSARIVTKGWGDTRPYTGCSKKDIARMKTQSEKDSANALNRRVEFRVLSFNYKPKSGKE